MRKKGFWGDTENQRLFLKSIADEMGFDPYQVDQWKRVTTAHIIAKKVLIEIRQAFLHGTDHSQGQRLLLKYNGSLQDAVEALFHGRPVERRRKPKRIRIARPSLLGALPHPPTHQVPP